MWKTVALALALIALGGCGGQGGPAGGAATSYDVTATLLTITPPAGQGGAWADFPKTFHLTASWDAATGVAFTGGDGDFSACAVATTDGRAYQSGGPWVANAAFSPGCGGLGSVAFSQIAFTLDGGQLQGTASGTATYDVSGTPLQADVTATLAGTADATPPAFTAPTGAVDPLAPLVFTASEPLPKTVAASLRGASSGDVVALSAGYIDNQERAVNRFVTPGVALRYGETYTLVTDHVADFAGHAPAAPVTFTTATAPPLVPEDGFESVTGTMFAGAGVLHGGPLTPLAGQTSLLLNTGFGGGFGFLPYDLGSSLAVQLAVAPGDTVVRFSSELITPDPIDHAFFEGAVRLASVGQEVETIMNVDGQDFAKVTLPQDGDVYISPEKTIELPLPAGAAGTITFEIIGVTFACEEPPAGTVLVLDDLRVE